MNFVDDIDIDAPGQLLRLMKLIQDISPIPLFIDVQGTPGIFLVILASFPQLSLWLPNLMTSG
jgi:hypothetical protein